jgi:hypothetical protein
MRVEPDLPVAHRSTGSGVVIGGDGISIMLEEWTDFTCVVRRVGEE